MRFGHNFWLGGPIDTRSMRLNCILQDLFLGITHWTIFGSPKYMHNRPNMPKTAKYAKYGQIYLPAIETLLTGLYHSGAKSSLWQACDGPRHRTRVQRGRQGEWLRASGGLSISRTCPFRHWDGGSKLRLDWVIYDYNRLLEFMELCSI